MNDQSWIMNLPSDITIKILSSLPVQTITSCKCVCKKWLKLLLTPEFAKSHFSSSTPSVAIYVGDGIVGSLKLYEFEDVVETDCHELCYTPVMTLDFTEYITPPQDRSIAMECSVNGLLFMRQVYENPNSLYVCNPITLECITISGLDDLVRYPGTVTYGFGVSAIRGQYKIVRIFHGCKISQERGVSQSFPEHSCQVYTLGTETWRSIAPDASLEYNCRSRGVFLNGNLHWLVRDLKGSQSISCLNLETELFRHFSFPHAHSSSSSFFATVVVLEDCLCVCENSSDQEIVIWVMKEYGITTSWTKGFVVSEIPNFIDLTEGVIYPVKVFKNGDMLMLWCDIVLLYYSQKNRTIAERFDMSERRGVIGLVQATHHVSSFISLKSFCGPNDEFTVCKF